ncbi:hypothetical protein KC980_03130, partial [candidate division WWE3 bacterium]|nr:hypothetical protein [candidate division WWE3 bacterium]
MEFSKTAHNLEVYTFIHNFVPHKHHKTRAKLLSHSAMFFYSFVFAVITLILFAAPSTFPGVLGYASNIQIRKLLD